MPCAACDLTLAADDNYCRRCGAPVRVVQVAPAPHRTDVARTGVATPALLAGAARPLATGAAAVAAGALVRFALRRAVRGLAGSAAQKAVPATGRALAPSEPALTPPAALRVTEVFWYRRIERTQPPASFPPGKG